jgi:Zn-dependent protease
LTHPVLVALGAADLRQVGIYVISLILAITVHEFAHAFAAHRLGDPTPEREGRLTLNPVAHADPVGTLVLPVVLALSGTGLLFGWGRPVNTQPRLYRRDVSMRGGMALVAFAGPLANLLLAAITLAGIWLLRVVGVLEGPSGIAFGLMASFYGLNVLLFSFNLIPLHPLDGGKVLAWLLARRRPDIDQFLERWGGMILIVLVVALPQVLEVVLGPISRLSQRLLLAIL